MPAARNPNTEPPKSGSPSPGDVRSGALILALTPVLMALALWLFSPGFLEPLFRTTVRLAGLPLGSVLLVCFFLLAAAGGLVNWRTRSRVGLFASMVVFMFPALFLLILSPAMVLIVEAQLDARSALPSFMAGGFPHEDPALEGRMPRSVGDLQLKVWSVRGEHILQVQEGGELPAVLTRLGRSVEDVSYAIAGRSADTEPPNWTFAYRIEGLSGEAIHDAFQAVNPLRSPPFETRTIAGRTVLIADGATGGSAAIVYAADDAYFLLLAPDLSSALAMLRQIDRGSGQ